MEEGDRPGGAAPCSPAWAWIERPGVAQALLCAIVASTYAGVVAIPFIWDDVHLLADVRAVEPMGALRVLWLRLLDADHFVDSPHYYRPIVLLSLHLDHAIWGERASGFHLLNGFVHIVNASLLMALCRRAGANAPLALAAALGFALFPRLTESVSWISGRSDLLASLGALTAIWLYTKPAASARDRVAAGGAMLFGLLAKEIAAAGWLALAAVEIQRARQERSVRRAALRFGPLALAAAVAAALRLSAGVSGSPSPFGIDERLGFAFQTLGTYLAMLLDPLHPAFRIGQTGELSPLVYLAGVLAAGTLLAAAVACWTRRWSAMPTIALALLGAGLLPVLHLLPTSIDVTAADRFLYVPVAGLCLGLAAVFARTRASIQRAALAAALIALPVFAWTVSQRNATWSDELALWRHTVAHASPLDPRPLQELAEVHAARGELEDALRAYEASFALRPERWVLERIGGVLFTLGRFEEALTPFERLARADPDRPQNHFHVGLVQHRLARRALAVASLERALALAPDFGPARQLLAEVRGS